MIICALVELIQHTRAPPLGEGGRRGGQERNEERQEEVETVTVMVMHSQTALCTKWTEEVSDVIHCHLLWERTCPRDTGAATGVRGTCEG